MANSPPFWDARVHAVRRPLLLARNRIAAALRGFFAARDFVEVETAILQASPGNEAHLHAFATSLVDPDGSRSTRYLRTSPEFASKKLLAAGEPRIFEFARSFRNGERGALHNPEFTLLEWYRAGEGYESLMLDCAGLLATAAEAAGARRLTFRGRIASPMAQPERMTVADAFERFAHIDLLQTIFGNEVDRDRLAASARDAGVRVADDDSWVDVFSRVLVERIEPNLGIGRATILYEYPIAQAGWARPCAADGRFAERFELYACGVELANAFGELTDVAEQRRRFEHETDLKVRLYGERYPIDEDFLDALARMPEASGIALGFDRLVMLLTGASHIEQVLWTL